SGRPLGRRRPGKPSLLQDFVVQAEALTIKIKKLHTVATPSTKGEDRTPCRLLAQNILRKRSQAFYPLPHVGDPASQVHPNARAWSDHAASTARIRRVRMAALMSLSKRRLRPRHICSSIILEGRSASLLVSGVPCATDMSKGRNTGPADGNRSPFFLSSRRQV